jgi:Heavy metal binding domain
MNSQASTSPKLLGWACPSHPEILWDAPGRCPRCRKDLQPGSLPAAMVGPAAPSSRRRFLKTGVFFLSGLFWLASPLRRAVYAQGMGPGGGMGMGRHGPGGMMGGGMMVPVPDHLPTPTSSAWLDHLREVLSLERLSLVQYQTDEDKFHVYRPYMMIIPQEENHIQLISQLFSAYGLSSAGPTPAIKRSQTITQAYEIAMGLEADLMPRYERLISGAEDRDTQQVLDTILGQTRMHYRMFSMAQRMGGGMGPGMMR